MDAIAIAIAGAAASIATTIFANAIAARRLNSEIRQNNANAAESLSQSASELIEPYRKEVILLRQQIAELYARVDVGEREIIALRQENVILQRRIAELEKENGELKLKKTIAAET